MHPTPSEYFLETALYQPLPLDSTESVVALAHIQFATGPLDAVCVDCGRQSVFQSSMTLPEIGPGLVTAEPAANVDELLAAKQAWLPATDDDSSSLSKQAVVTYLRRPKYFTSIFRCSRNAAHELLFVTRVSVDHFEKIGQRPSLADLHLAELTKYRKFLGSRYAELARGVGLFAHGIGIGSFVYLRRIFEWQIEEAHIIASKDHGWDEDRYQRSRMDDKILLLKGHLPPFVVDNRALYSVLSKGIHELSEDECLIHFPAVRVAIELILDEKLEAVERAKKMQDSLSDISTIKGKLKGSAS